MAAVIAVSRALASTPRSESSSPSRWACSGRWWLTTARHAATEDLGNSVWLVAALDRRTVELAGHSTNRGSESGT